MKRKRYSYRRRVKQNVSWQPVQFSAQWAESWTKDTVINHSIGNTTPGVGVAGATGFQPFANDHTLLRIVGSVVHTGSNKTTVSGNEFTTFPLSIGAIKVPSEFDNPSDLNLFDTKDADDYLFRLDRVCDTRSSAALFPNWDQVDSKSKRRFDVGDRIGWFVSWLPNLSDSTSPYPLVSIIMNLRILWKLDA